MSSIAALPATSRINAWLLAQNLRIAANPCISPDHCLDWPALRAALVAGAPRKEWPGLSFHETSRFALASGQVVLVEDPTTGDCAWFIDGGRSEQLADGVHLGGQRWAYPASWANLLALKNLVQSYDPDTTIFPTAAKALGRSSLGIGARFTTLHWSGVDWAMAQLGLPLTANQNSIPRELVYDVDAMLDGTLISVPFPFIGGEVPEGHQGQSVEGMSHGCVLAKLKTGFHRRRIPWGFNADHQPIGGRFDAREDALVRGCLLATYITFDLSPELATGSKADPATIPASVVSRVKTRVAEAGVALDDAEFRGLLGAVWPSLQKMQRRDRAYAAARQAAFTTTVGRAYWRELSIDELPGLTTPATLATMLALAEALDMPVNFVAPAFGFQKNFPFADQVELERRISAAWRVCTTFNVSIGFHSGSGKSRENYELCGRLTGGAGVRGAQPLGEDSTKAGVIHPGEPGERMTPALEIKTSGRYTYEMGVALSRSSDAADQALWKDWYAFTRELALASAFGTHEAGRTMARDFITRTLAGERRPSDVFADLGTCRKALEALTPSPEHMLWFEYNFLYVLAARGSHERAALGDHGPAGYAQRARFYAISAEGRLRYAQGVAGYILFLAETTGLAPAARCAAARAKLDGYRSLADLVRDIAG